MRQRIAVEDGLRPVKERLRAGGFDVVSLSGGVPDGVCAIVVNGLDDNLMGRQDIVTRIAVINADGLTPEQVVDEVQRRAAAARTPR